MIGETEMSMTDDDTTRRRTIAVKLPRTYYRTVRRIAAEHELANAQVICWAIDLLTRYAADGGVYAR